MWQARYSTPHDLIGCRGWLAGWLLLCTPHKTCRHDLPVQHGAAKQGKAQRGTPQRSTAQHRHDEKKGREENRKRDLRGVLRPPRPPQQRQNDARQSNQSTFCWTMSQQPPPQQAPPQQQQVPPQQQQVPPQQQGYNPNNNHQRMVSPAWRPAEPTNNGGSSLQAAMGVRPPYSAVQMPPQQYPPAYAGTVYNQAAAFYPQQAGGNPYYAQQRGFHPQHGGPTHHQQQPATYFPIQHQTPQQQHLPPEQSGGPKSQKKDYEPPRKSRALIITVRRRMIGTHTSTPIPSKRTY